ncbi:MAG TPA: ATP-binding protein [bacterium]|nr:ATP-binding protein [bacterium]HPS30634.1 ATP-binding protein [bacterium]
MKIAVASGKGGTGKTTVSLALAMTALSNVELQDCDVEEPNGHIFLKLENVIKENVSVPVPEINTDSCISCGKCSEICQFNAIVFFGSPPMIFKELCHSCGGCVKICPVSAIREIPNVIGHITTGKAGSIEFIQGQLNIGVPMASPVIRQVIRLSGKREDTVIDSPPGTSCSMISAVKESDFVILVTEPTPFGLNDLQIAVETIEKLFIPMGVIINRSDSGDDRVEEYCKEKGLELLMKIPFSTDIAKAYSNGMPLINSAPQLAEKFKEIWTKVRLHKRESK